MRRRMAALTPEARTDMATTASRAAVAALPPPKPRAPRPKVPRAPRPILSAEHKRIRKNANSAKHRCTCSRTPAFKHYGGRGIEFRFATPEAFTRWVLDNLGPRPSLDHSIDRIDNDGHYEAGNLRWATKVEQMNNRRPYTLKEKPDAATCL